MKDPNLDLAYRLKSPDDSRKLYAKWAQDYDSAFAEDLDYQLPFAVADTFVRLGGTGPVLDVGAGTGLAAHGLREQGITQVEGTDIAPEMLQVAEAKSLYDRTFVCDITDHIPAKDGQYQGVISSGTFTLGHVGPEALAEVFRVVAPGGLAVISVSRAHYDAAGFDMTLQGLSEKILRTEIEVPIYGPKHGGVRAGDMAILVCAQMR